MDINKKMFIDKIKIMAGEEFQTCDCEVDKCECIMRKRIEKIEAKLRELEAKE